MTFDIQLKDLTNATTVTNGTGIYDVLMQSAERHIESQYQKNRLSGTEYAQVYLGAMQSALSESVKFALTEKQSSEQAALIAEQVKSEVKNNEAGGVIDLTKREIQEKIDLVVAQTAERYQNIAAIKADTNRKNLLNSKEATHREKETALVIRQESELELDGIVKRGLITEQTIKTTSDGLNNTNKANAEVALIDEKTDQLKLDGPSRRSVEASQVSLTDQKTANLLAEAANIPKLGAKIDEEVKLITAQELKVDKEVEVLEARRTEVLASTSRQNSESTQKVALMVAQTTGFKSDAKQKLLRQMSEAYAVNVTTVGEVTASPTGAAATAIDAVMNDILDDWGSTVGW